MGYNTRRVSLSLPSLGIHLPGSHAASRANHHKSNPTSAAQTPSAGVTKPSTDSPPAKRVKRSHTITAIPSALSRTSTPSRPRKSSSISLQPTPRSPQQPQLSHRPILLGTPPPSPRAHDSSKIDTEGINDDIVVAVLEQLQSTGNRPHLIKELVAVLITLLSSVESSQNPTAIISSRLTSYLKRPWTALARCPLAKEQVTVHPRRVYYFLTTMPRQEIPEYADTPMTHRHVISPSISSGPDEEEEMELRVADERWQSPEIDFPSLVELNPSHNMTDLPYTLDTFDDGASELFHLPREQRLASPPLEYDEREFTQTASVMQLRKESEEAQQKQQQLLQTQLEQASLQASNSTGDNTYDQAAFDPTHEVASGEEESAEATALHNQEAAVLLFGHSHQHLLQSLDLSSPIMGPQQLHYSTLSALTSTPKQPSSAVEGGAFGMDIDVEDPTMLDAYGAWGDLKSPEHVELAELDDMFDCF